jgi:hypothetical protein
VIKRSGVESHHLGDSDTESDNAGDKYTDAIGLEVLHQPRSSLTTPSQHNVPAFPRHHPAWKEINEPPTGPTPSHSTCKNSTLDDTVDGSSGVRQGI